MNLPNLRRVVAFVVLTVGCAWTAHGQCLDWRTFPLTGVPETRTNTIALLVHDDGSGPALYHGLEPLDPMPAEFSGIQRWNGTSYSAVGAGLHGTVKALVAFDDGSGPALYAGGQFTIPGGTGQNIARWDGTAWHGFGSGMDDTVAALAVHDDGSGPALFVGGYFLNVDGVPASRIARWDGTAWSSLGLGIGGQEGVLALESFDDGTGLSLFVGGHFPVPNAPGALNIARWSNGNWSSVGGGSYAPVRGLATGNFGSGPSLYAVGDFYETRVWNGTTWTSIGPGAQQNMDSVEVLDLGQGPRLYTGTAHSPQCGLRCWDGTTWTLLNSPTSETCDTVLYGSVLSIAAFNEGAGPRLFAGSTPGALGSLVQGVSRWNGSVWEGAGSTARGFRGTVLKDLHVFDGGSGPALYAGGTFCGADDSTARGVARWDGSKWSLLGTVYFLGPTQVSALATFVQGGVPALMAATDYTSLFRWNGTNWTHAGGTLHYDSSIYALQQLGSYLYIGGRFTILEGAVSPNIVRWNGTTFSTVGNGSLAGVNGAVNALLTFDDGGGNALFAGGTFTLGNGVSMNRIGRWNGTNWAPLGSGTNGLVDALVVHDDGTGSALYAAGVFSTAGGVPASNVARWNPATSTWSALGAGLNAQVLTLGTFDDGSGPALYAGGNFNSSGSTPIQRIAKWNGTSWSAVGAGTDGPVWTLQSHDDGTGIGAQLFVGGEFQHAGTLPSELLAAWRGCEGPIARFCFGDGSVAACPCGNQGLSGRGCDNSFGTGGARMNATGTAQPDTISIHVGGELPNAATLVFQGSALLTGPVPFGDGLRCTGGNILRMYTTNASSGSLTVPATGQTSISARSAALGDPLAPGTVRSYQSWYRDSNPDFCGPPAGNAWNLSNAVRIEW